MVIGYVFHDCVHKDFSHIGSNLNVLQATTTMKATSNTNKSTMITSHVVQCFLNNYKCWLYVHVYAKFLHSAFSWFIKKYNNSTLHNKTPIFFQFFILQNQPLFFISFTSLFKLYFCTWLGLNMFCHRLEILLVTIIFDKTSKQDMKEPYS